MVLGWNCGKREGEGEGRGDRGVDTEVIGHKYKDVIRESSFGQGGTGRI